MLKGVFFHSSVSNGPLPNPPRCMNPLSATCYLCSCRQITYPAWSLNTLTDETELIATSEGCGVMRVPWDKVY